jgi:hypothetical protein
MLRYGKPINKDTKSADTKSNECGNGAHPAGLLAYLFGGDRDIRCQDVVERVVFDR